MQKVREMSFLSILRCSDSSSCQISVLSWYSMDSHVTLSLTALDCRWTASPGFYSQSDVV